MSLTTFTLLHYPPAARAWAFLAVGRHRRLLARVEGLRFVRHCGTGIGPAFSLAPNLDRYALIAVWDSPAAADRFFDEGAFMRAHRSRAREEWTARLQPVLARGEWDGERPFVAEPRGARPDAAPRGPLAVLTRATLRPGAVRAFWQHAGQATEALTRAEGCLASVGFGEVPLVRLGTLSLWRSEEDIRRYAYQTESHREVIRARREGRWYREELFARFVPLSSSGTWDGGDPLRA